MVIIYASDDKVKEKEDCMFNPADWGLIPDGHDIARELEKALKENDSVTLPKGEYMTSPLDIPSGAHLILEEGAVLKFIPDFSIYEPVFTRWEGVKCYCMHPCVYIDNAKDVTIEGKGVIDGSGQAWWDEALKKKGKVFEPTSDIEKKFAALNPDYKTQADGGGGRPFQFLRPPLMQIKNSSNITLRGITVQNSPFWTLHPLFSDHIVLDGVTVLNPYDAPNTDGIDIESSTDVKVLNCSVFVGDDGIALKSGSGPDGIADNMPTQRIEIRGCTVKAAHGGAVIGSETAAEISDLIVADCVFDGTDRGIRIKSRRGRGGKIHDLVFRNIIMRKNFCPFVVNMYYRCGVPDPILFSLDKMPVTEETPVLYNILIEDCHAVDSRSSAGMLLGLPEVPLKDVVVRNSSFAVAKDPDLPITESDMYTGVPDPVSRGFRIMNAEVKLENVEVECEGEKIIMDRGAVLL